jgi:hypothetical protein
MDLAAGCFISALLSSCYSISVFSCMASASRDWTLFLGWFCYVSYELILQTGRTVVAHVHTAVYTALDPETDLVIIQHTWILNFFILVFWLIGRRCNTCMGYRPTASNEMIIIIDEFVRLQRASFNVMPLYLLFGLFNDAVWTVLELVVSDERNDQEWSVKTLERNCRHVL